MPRVARAEILTWLRSARASGSALLGAGCSIGIIARSAEAGGADLIIVYSTGLSRLQGHQTTIPERPNAVTLEMAPDILAVVKAAPVVAGVDAEDHPTGRDLEVVLGEFVDAGFSGVINFPTKGYVKDPAWRRNAAAQGRGFAAEVELVRLAHAMDLFTMAYVFYPQDARAMTKAGVDCIVPHVGGTAGGDVGFVAMSLRSGAARVQRMLESARKVRPDIICLGHGGPFAEFEDVRYLLGHTDVDGFVGASTIERIPIERAVKQVVSGLKTLKPRGG